jgi:putative aminopeptidase FrvX
MQIASLLNELSQSPGVSGYENPVREMVRREFERLADDVRVDKMGNLVALKRGETTGNDPRRSVMLAAHMDEIGLLVTKLDEGFLRFATVGGFDVRTLPGQEVIVHGRVDLPGVIGSRTPHVLPLEERKKVTPLDGLFIDVGLPEAELKRHVRVGDIITLRGDFAELQTGYVSGKAMDDRAGVASLICCLHAMTAMRSTWDVYAVATVQEEIGLRGAITSAYDIDPDIAIAVDVGFGRTPGLSEGESAELNEGPGIGIGPNIHPLMHSRLVETAKKHEIPFQTEAIPGRSGTDAWAIQVAREGIPTALLSIPLRYMHTPIETAHTKDIERTGRLMALLASSLDQQFATELGLHSRPRT